MVLNAELLSLVAKFAEILARREATTERLERPENVSSEVLGASR